MGAEGDAYMAAWFRYVLDSDKEAEKASLVPMLSAQSERIGYYV